MTRTGRELWRAVLPRVGADVAIVALSLAAGFLARLLVAVGTPGRGDPAELVDAYRRYYFELGPLLAAILVATFALGGVYTKKRFYAQRYKVLALAQGISLAYAVFLLAAYLFRYSGSFFVPRAAFLISYALTLAGAIGSRWLKACVLDRFRIESKRPAGRRAPRNILVVGGAGYIGSVLVRDLLADGYRVRVLDSLACGDGSIRALYGHPAFELIAGDFRHAEPVVRAVRGMDAVIHLGAIVGDPACAVDEDETLETNLAATRLLAEVSRASGVSRILFASTCSVYGAADHLVDERSSLNPVSLYAATKIDSENVLLAARGRDFHPVILRLATAFGWSHRPRFDLVANLLPAKALIEKRILIYNGQQWRPFIHVADASRAMRLALGAPLELVSGEIFNAGSNHMNVTLRQLAEEIAAVEPDLAVEYVNNSDARSYRVSFDKIRARLGFLAERTLASGVAEIRDAIARGEVTDYRDPRYSNLELVTQRREANGSAPGANDEIELTALQFAKNSLWRRALDASRSPGPLLRYSASLASLARKLETAGTPAVSPTVPETEASASRGKP